MKRDYTRLEENIRNLKLTFISDNYKESAVHAAAKSLDHIAYLESLIAGETALKQENIIKNRIRNARFPYIKTLEQYNFNHPSKINRMQIENIFRLDFIEQNMNIILLGGCGVGKTHISIALAQKTCSKGISVLFSPAVDIINSLSCTSAQMNLDKAIKKYTLPKLLVIDELGYLPIDKLGANLLFQVISKRYETGSIILTSNRAFKEWPKIFDNDSTVTSAVLDSCLLYTSDAADE